ncbi:MAG: alpha/beta hydrolase [Saprospiraceae bacterium]|nr:alpha/beta hydrolase [Saprospiraceae bacterium]
MKALRVFIRLVLAVCILLFAAGLVINLFNLFTFRKPDAAILAAIAPADGFTVAMDSVGYERGTICYAAVRLRSAEPRDAVFFVHGSPGALDAYTPYLQDQRLRERADLFSYDRPGFGQTRPIREEPSLAAQAAALAALIRETGARRNILVGHSLGSSIIARYAMDYPDEVHGLVLISAPIDPDLEPPNWWRYLLDFPLIRVAVPRPLAISNAELLPLKEELRTCLPHWSAIRCPVYFVHGDRDQLVPVGNVAFGERVLDGDVPQTSHVVSGEGHFILWTHVDEIVDVIITALD